ncbi:MAG: hypothetical protein RL111_1890 [Pseudomonadota bacterium]|jgi:hypothetical protein
MAHTSSSPLPLAQLTRVMRSKNAGPLCLTIDVFFHERVGFDRALQSPALLPSAVAALYGLAPDQVQRRDWPEVLAIKFAMPRRHCAGSPGDGDVYGAQQHAPLLEVQV